jgi:hypothetical protein
MKLPLDPSEFFREHAQLINEIAIRTAQRGHLPLHEQDAFLAFVRQRFAEDDYAIVRKFRRLSSVKTYCVTVVNHLSLDFTAQRWGEWQPTIAARRLGPIAVLFERLTTRDHHSPAVAVQIMRREHGVTLSNAQFHELWKGLLRAKHQRERPN